MIDYIVGLFPNNPKALKFVSEMKRKKNPKARKPQEASSKKLILIIGPSGCGKTSFLKFLLQEIGVEMVKATSLVKKSPVINEHNGISETGLNYTLAIKHALHESFQAQIKLKEINKSIVINDLPVPRYDHNNWAELQKVIMDLVPTFQRFKPNIPIFFVLNSSLYSESLLQRLFGDFLFKKTLFKVFKIPKVTEAVIKSTLENIVENKTGPEYSVNFDILQNIKLTCFGDIRQAIMQLDFLGRVPASERVLEEKKPKKKGKKKSKKNLESEEVLEVSEKDEKMLEVAKKNKKSFEFSLFHSLGKFLHNKRLDVKQGVTKVLDSKDYKDFERYPFYFEPREIVAQVNCSLPLFRDFLHENVFNFCGKVRQLATILDVSAHLEDLATRTFLESVRTPSFDEFF